MDQDSAHIRCAQGQDRVDIPPSEGPAPAPDPENITFYSSLRLFDLVAQDGSGRGKVAQHKPQTRCKLAQHSPKLAQDGPT